MRERLRELRVFEGRLAEFDPEAAPEQPGELFSLWLAEAIDARLREPHAMTLSTVDTEGRPNARVLILKGIDEGRWQFASSSESGRGIELAATPWAAITFYWSELGRQVRLRGRVATAPSAASGRDFLARSRGGRAAALAGRSGDALRDPSDLDVAIAAALGRIDADPATLSDEWTLYELVAHEVEFWQADRERRHVRLRYHLGDDRWSRQRLWP